MAGNTEQDGSVDRAVAALRAGRLVVLPTETVYGLGADASNPLALRQVFAAKGRPVDHPLIVHVADLAAAEILGWLPPLARTLAARFWPGPLTMVVRRRSGVVDEATGGLPTVGLRVPDHPLTLQVLQAFDGGVAAPSANRFGSISPTSALHVRQELGPDVHVLDGGPCAVGLESTILDLSHLPALDEPDLAPGTPILLRPGGLPVEDIEALIGPLARTGGVKAPGSLAAHYAPHTSLLLAADPAAEADRLRNEGRRVAVLPPRDATLLAPLLYAELRRLDALGVDVLVAGLVGPEGLGLAINDRLRRAAHGSGAGST
jgi:L-threonylcarbamoyladenylate synthase